MIAEMPQQTAYTRTLECVEQTTVAYGAFCQSPEMAKWAPVMRELLGLRSLRDNWDGDGSDAPSREVLRAAMRLAEFLRDKRVERPDSAAASRAGTVIFAWRSGKRYEEIEVAGPELYEWMVVDQDGTDIHGEFALPIITQEAQSDASLSARPKLSA
jgi:hypothetical protein